MFERGSNGFDEVLASRTAFLSLLITRKTLPPPACEDKGPSASCALLRAADSRASTAAFPCIARIQAMAVGLHDQHKRKEPTMKLYLVRQPTGDGYLINMYDEMDAIWNGNLGTPVEPFKANLGDEDNPDIYEVYEIYDATQDADIDSSIQGAAE